MTKCIGVVIPARNELGNLPKLLSEFEDIARILAAGYQLQIQIIDDGSSDGSVDYLKDYKPVNLSLKVCSFTRNFGKESAISAGLERCESDAVVIMDADLQHPPDLIPEMIARWEEGYRVVEAVKAGRGKENMLYGFSSKLFYILFRVFGSIDLENLSDYKLLDKEVVEAIKALPEQRRFFRGLVSWLGNPAFQIPFNVPDRESRRSSWSNWQLVRYSIDSLSSFSSAPLQIITVIEALMLLTSVVFGSVALYQWAVGNAVTGFTTVILLLLGIGSMLMISVGIIGLYISKIYDEIKSRPVYIVKNEFVRSTDEPD